MSDNNQDRLVDADELRELFTPDWVREEPGRVSVVKESRSRSQRPEHSDRGARRQSRPPRKGQEQRGGDRPPSSPPRTERATRQRSERVPRTPQRSREPAPELPLKISFLPERHGLGIIVRRIRSSKKAFPLPVIADLFLKKPEFFMMKVEAAEGSGLRLFQCGVCKELFQSRELAEEHLFNEHADEFFDIEVVQGEPPAGVFQCMAVCGLTKKLLGPPNHHTYRDKVREVHRTTFPEMSISDYEGRIQMLSDPEAIETWKSELSIRTQYKSKDSEDAEPMDAKAARIALIDKRGREVIKQSDRFVVPAPAAWSSKDGQLLAVYKSAYNKESRFPATMIHALRPALKHMRMHFIKVRQRETFVTAVKPAPIDPAESVSPIKEALEFIKLNPLTDRGALFGHLSGNFDNFDQVHKKVQSDIHWLVDCGHLIEFSDGSLMLP